ncbi:MFS general substrate transporter [Martensiomyces pterosporus]|nr:MFS general substrate transporter [Martensiomyces pterosporus]
MAVFPLFWSNIAERYGRRNVYIASMLIYTAGSIGCALSKNIASLLVSRLIQSAGSSSVLGVGAGTIADIFERKERGTAMGLYFLGALLGPPLAPIIGGVVGQHLGWRAIFWMLTIMAGVSLLALILFLPETHRRIVAQKHQIRPVNIPEVPTWRENNPIQTLMYARNPIVMAVIFHNAMVFGGYIAMSNSNTFVMSAIYKFTQTKTGLTYLGMGGGCLLGSVLGGRFVDFVLNRERKKLAGESANSEASGGQQIKVPAEIRVRYLWTGAVPFAASTIAYGWMIHAGTVPLGGVLVVQIICGTSLSWQLSFTSNYLIDLYPTRGASITASQAFFRSLWSGVCTQVLINMKTSIGWGWEFTIFGSLVALGLLLTLPITFRGEQLRNRFPI